MNPRNVAGLGAIALAMAMLGPTSPRVVQAKTAEPERSETKRRAAKTATKSRSRNRKRSKG